MGSDTSRHHLISLGRHVPDVPSAPRCARSAPALPQASPSWTRS